MYMDRVSAIKIYYIIININNTNSVIVINCVVILIPGSGCQFMCSYRSRDFRVCSVFMFGI